MTWIGKVHNEEMCQLNCKLHLLIANRPANTRVENSQRDMIDLTLI